MFAILPKPWLRNVKIVTCNFVLFWPTWDSTKNTRIMIVLIRYKQKNRIDEDNVVPESTKIL